jgi:hypothetical protein
MLLPGDGRHMRQRALGVVAGTTGLADPGQRLRMNEQVFSDRQAALRIDRLEL